MQQKSQIWYLFKFYLSIVSQRLVKYVSLCYKQRAKHLTHQSGVNPVKFQHFLPELSTEGGKTVHDWGCSTILRVSSFPVTSDKFLYILANVRDRGLHLLQESINAPVVNSSGTSWAEIIAWKWKLFNFKRINAKLSLGRLSCERNWAVLFGIFWAECLNIVNIVQDI